MSILTFSSLPPQIFVRRIFVLVTLAWACAPMSAHAIKPNRCNGRIQFTPCLEPSSDSAVIQEAPARTQKAHDPRFPISGTRYATLLESEYTQLSRSTGLWTGVVKGNGLVETELVITRHGTPPARRYMGHVWLQNKSTPFKITSAVPPGKGWDWEIRVWAR